MRTFSCLLALFFALAPAICCAQPTLARGQQPVVEEPPLAEVGVATRRDETGKFLQQGDRIHIQVTASPKADVYVYAIHFQADATAVLLFPNFKARDNRLRGGESRPILNDRTPLGFEVGAPFGPEVVRVLVANQPLPELEKLIDQNPKAIPVLPAEEAKKLYEYCEAGMQQGAWEIHDTEFEAREARVQHLQPPGSVVQ